MIAYAVYVISIDGRPIVSEKFQSADSIPNEMLLGGLFTALQGVAEEMTKNESELKSIEIENLSYHFKSFGYYRIILVTNLPETPDTIIQKLGLSFMKDFGEQLMDGFAETHPYRPFKKTINEIIQSELLIDESKSINPSKKFNSGVIFDLPEHVKATALAMISLQEGTLDEIADESGNSYKDTSLHITSLQQMGFIGRKKSNDHTLYFCSL